MIFVPIFNIECDCGNSPIVALEDERGTIRATTQCGVCYFGDRMMLDWELWNEQPEATE